MVKRKTPNLKNLKKVQSMVDQMVASEPLPPPDYIKESRRVIPKTPVSTSDLKKIDQSKIYDYDEDYQSQLDSRSYVMHKPGRIQRFTESIFPINNPDTGTLWDDRFYTQLNQASLIDLDPRSSQIAQRLCLLEYRKNVRAWNAVELLQEFCVGEEIKWHCMSPKVQRILDDHWDINEWDEKLPERVRSLILFGEQLFPAFVSGTGLVRVSSITPLRILAVTRNSEDAESMENVKVNLSTSDHVEAGQRIYSYRIIRPRQLNTPMEGDAFYFAANRVGGGSRGIPDFLPALDWLETNDNFAFACVERFNIAMSVVYELTFNELTDAQVKKKLQEFGRALRSGDIYGHNDKVKLDMKAPQLGGVDIEHAMNVVHGQIQSGTRFPGIYFGDPTGLSRSSATEMSLPVSKMIGAKQMFIKRMIERIFDYQLEQSIMAGQLDPTTEDLRYEIEMPNVFLRDMQAVGKSLVDVSTALTAGQQEGWVDKVQAGRVFRLALEQLGIDVAPPTSNLDVSGQTAGSPGAVGDTPGVVAPAPVENPVKGSYQEALKRRKKTA